MNSLRDFPIPRRRATLGLLLALVVVLSACGVGQGDSWPGVAASNGDVFVAYGDKLIALDAASGTLKWEYDEGDGKFYAIPVVDDGTVYIGDWSGQMHAIDRETGQAQWVYEPDHGTLIGPISTEPEDRVISGAAIDAERIYFGLGSQNVVAISRETAEEVWTLETDHGVWATPLLIPNEPDGPATLYVVSLDHHLYAVDPETGDHLWRKDLGGAAAGGLAYDAERGWVYVGTFLSEIVAVDLNTHDIVDRFETDNWVWSAPALEEDMLYVGDLSGHLYAVRVTDGGFEQVWEQDVSGSGIRSTPLLTEDLVIVGSKDKRVYALSKDDGTQEWEAQMKGEVLSEITFVQADALADGAAEDEAADLVVVGTESGDDRVVAVRIDSGAIDWRYND